ncbi:hypothetical protein [Streptomyces sp. SID8352]|uniref:hypothetical protein n=1 Tax=Streptomyces sp. SID8352 TaxID=2690338 RepID=UPI00136F8824|nr:hypothetical protein [Streptomyces sp. SID8352]MYU21199.1 hypothetical protein [Streptomyces sp. SID8352]
MIRYRNANTDDIVERAHPDARLEMLPNWERLQPDDATGPPQESSGGEGGRGPGAERPARSAPKAAWQEYARTVASDSDEEAAVEDLTKDDLVERYGAPPPS